MRFFRLLYLAFWDWVYRKIAGPTVVIKASPTHEQFYRFPIEDEEHFP